VDTDKSSAPAQPTTDEKYDDVIEAHYACVERLVDRYRHELMNNEERMILRDQIIRMRSKLRQSK
jgi:hypothetical protein